MLLAVNMDPCRRVLRVFHPTESVQVWEALNARYQLVAFVVRSGVQIKGPPLSCASN